ncbi:MAG TPA: hypothetical protein VIR61_00180, partial [Sulfuricaulis sp.]
TETWAGAVIRQIPESLLSTQSTLSNGFPSLAFVVTVMGCVSVEVIVAHPGAKTIIQKIE